MIICLDLFSKQFLSILVYFDLYQSFKRLPCSNLQIHSFILRPFLPDYRITDEARIAETVVWPNLFLMNVFFALTGSDFLAHLSRRLKGELIVYRSIRRLCVRA